MKNFEKIALYGMSKALPGLLLRRNKENLSILIYHRVLLEADYLRSGDPSALEFDWQMELLSRYFFPLGLADALARLDAGNLPKNAVCITFDDGYSDNESVALPILKKWGIPATVFVSTGYLNGGRMWNDTIIESIRAFDGDSLDAEPVGLGRFDLSSRVNRIFTADKLIKLVKHLPITERSEATAFIQSCAKRLPDDLMMTNKQLLSMYQHGIEIGAHTVTHPILHSVGEAEATLEIEQSKKQLQSIIDDEVRLFAYPNGNRGVDYTELHSNIVKNLGFMAGVSTDWGTSNRNTDRFNLPRFTPWDKTPLKFYIRMIMNGINGDGTKA